MYHSRTKKVASYGRHAQRVVAVSDDRRFTDDVFSDPSRDRLVGDQPPRSSQKNDYTEDIFVVPSKPVPPKPVVADSKTRRRPGASSSPKKNKTFGKDTPIRRPLGSFQVNVPNSPALSPKVRKARAGNGKGSSLGLRKVPTISPYVDVNIVVLDGAGRRLSEEHRIKKTNVQNAIDSGTTKPTRRARRLTSVKSYAVFAPEEDGNDDDEEDDEYIPVLKPSRKGKRDAKEPASSLRSRKSRKPKQKRPDEQLLDSPSNSELPRRSRTSKRTIATVVITDSESESNVEGSSKTEQAHRSVTRRISGVHPRRARENSAKGTSIITIPDCPDTMDISCKPHPSLTQRLQGRKKPRGSQPSHTKKPVNPTSQGLKLSVDRDPSSQLHGPDEFYTSHPHFHQLTPLKPFHPNAAFLHQPPARLSPSQHIVVSDDEITFSIDAELELALQVADLQVSNVSHPSSKSSVGMERAAASTSALKQKLPSVSQSVSQRPHIPSFLRPLLSECGQLTIFDFASFIETFPADPVIGFSGIASFLEQPNKTASFNSFQKVGEASYSEVFGIGNVVLKIIPLLDEENDASITWSADWDSPPVSEAKDVLKEIVVTRAMGEICKGFIKLLKAHVVQGSYPKSLLALWDKHDAAKGSESVRPDHFTAKQTYVIIILPNGGPDLENFSFNSLNLMGGSGWRQACSIFWQVARSLAHAEELVHFEHRDLHWGQILVRNTRKTSSFLGPTRFSTNSLDDPSHGVQSTIIDLGLARIDHGHGESFWTPFTEEIFEGEGDYQYDIYRMMRKHNKDEWRSFRPLTNVMWLHYLAHKLLHYKQLRAPTSVRSSRKSIRVDEKLAIMEADKRAYDCLVEVEQVLAHSIVSISQTIGVKHKKRTLATKQQASVTINVNTIIGEPKSAADVLQIGKENCWIL